MATQSETRDDELCIVFDQIRANVSEEMKVQMFNHYRRPGQPVPVCKLVIVVIMVTVTVSSMYLKTKIHECPVSVNKLAHVLIFLTTPTKTMKNKTIVLRCSAPPSPDR